MVEQVYMGVTAFTLQYQALNSQLYLNTTDVAMQAMAQSYAIMIMLTTLAWLVDSNNAAIGYFWESPFTKTWFRETDPYPLHWVITLACYFPLIYFVNQSLVSFPNLPDTSQRAFNHTGPNVAIDVTMVIVLLLYMASGSALAFSFSNLSYKKIQTRGPYRFVRHPSITFKIIWFTLAFYRFSAAYTVAWLFCYLFWMGLYISRAFIEERFLRRFPDYQAYMQKTKYRFIPGIV